MPFNIHALDPAPFAPLFAFDDATLAGIGALRVVCDAANAFPCRVSLADAAPGETLLLINHEHQPAESPFRSRHAIYVREGAAQAAQAIDEVPAQLRSRTLSLRAFDMAGMIVKAELVDGVRLEPALDALLAQHDVEYVHIHFAAYGCFAARAERA